VDWTRLSNRLFRLDSEGISLLQQILAAQAGDQEDRIFSLLTLLLLKLQEQTEQKETRTVAVSGENTTIRKTQQYVQAHVMEKLTVPGVAAGVGVSASYLTALFHKHLSISPGEYIRRVKLGKSKQLIREGQMNFTEISESLQYSTVHHFSRQFKQMFGMTPTEYAKSVR
jgi:AraC-like DNA-binding protein